MELKEIIRRERKNGARPVNTGCIKIPDGYAILADNEWVWWVQESNTSGLYVESKDAFFTVWECLADIKRRIKEGK